MARTKLVCIVHTVLFCIFAIRIFCRDHLLSHAGFKNRKNRCHADIEIFTQLISLCIVKSHQIYTSDKNVLWSKRKALVSKVEIKCNIVRIEIGYSSGKFELSSGCQEI